MSLTRAQGKLLSLASNDSIISNAGGTADAITGSYTPAIPLLTNGMTVFVRASSANATTTPTFTPNAGVVAAKVIVKGNGLALVPGDISGAGHWVEFQYDSTLDKWILLNPAAGVGVTPPSNDNSSKNATTAWLYNAMATVMNYFGFAVSLATNGYIKLPSILGGVIIQWANFIPSDTSQTTFYYPIVFPNGVFGWAAGVAGSTGATLIRSGGISASSIQLTSSSISSSHFIIVIGF